MMNIVENYMNWLDDIAGEENEIICIDKKEPQIFISFYDDIPEEGYKTAYSFGLSSIKKSECGNTSPELLISVSDSDNSWGLAMGEIIKQCRYKCKFGNGDVFNFKSKISDNSDMSCFLVYANSLYEPGDEVAQFNDRTIKLLQFYPIYLSEMELISDKGVDYFIKKGIRLGVDMFDVTRQVI